jgi:hypothetical protein
MTNNDLAAAERVRRAETCESLCSIYDEADFQVAFNRYTWDRMEVVKAYLAQQPTYADLARELAEAKAEIERLKALLLKARPLIVQKFNVSEPWVVNEIDAALEQRGK